jgi:isopenicillin-N N-acyltransferase-like protein
MRFTLSLSLPLTFCLCFQLAAEEKKEVVTGNSKTAADPEIVFRVPVVAAKAERTVIQTGEVKLPLVVVKGTPYEMGWQLGDAMKSEILEFVPGAVAGFAAELGVTTETLQEVWARTSSYGDDRVEQEMAGLADGSGVPLSTLQAMHALPLLMPYSCSSIAAWGDATEDGHLYQSRNLDWSLEIGAHEFPVIVVYQPTEGASHVIPSFVGMIGAHTGMNVHGIALAEMGDASTQEAPYFVHAPHFTVFFRTLLYDANSLTKSLEIFQAQPMTKRYHFVFGDGRSEKQAVKIRAHAPEAEGQRLSIWKANDSTDEFAPNVLSCIVYNDEGRGVFPALKREFGKLNGEKLVSLANSIPIKGGNVVNVIYDATALRMWVTYAKGEQEAYERPSLFVDLQPLLK